MIPLELTLKNFLSYREATLNFRGLHTACICGKNGSGKSGLLEAIAWSLWGESRAASEDDLIHIGTSEVRVDLVFSKDEQTYRVIRSRQRKGPSTLEFQVQTEKGFSSLTAGKMRATQQLITQQLKLDYETFVNSAYLRQGGSDEFMLKGPTERKHILAKLLSLDQYDSLAEQAKERSRLLKGQVDLQAHRLSEMERELKADSEIAEELANLEKKTAALSASQNVTRQQLQSLQTLYHQQQAQQQQLSWHRSQYRVLSEECDRLQQELTAATQKQREIESLLETKSAITEAYARFQHLQEREEVFAAKFQAHQAAQAQLQQLLATKAEQVGELQKQLRKSQAQLEALCQQEQELQQTLSQQSEVEAGLQQLRLRRDRLAYLDRLQLQVAPLLRRRQQLESQLERDRAYLSAKLEELQTSLGKLQEDRARAPQLQEAAQEIQDRIQQLEKQRTYQQRVLEKGQEMRHFMERLQADQRSYETQLGELNQKIQILNGTRSTASTDESQENESFGVCPLCDRPLDEHHWHLVQQKHLCQQQEILDRLWVVREQLATSDREIQILRTEYQELDEQLRQLTPALEKRGELQARLDVTSESLVRLHALRSEAAKIEQSLSTAEYAAPLQAELRLIEERLHALNYDEKDHALVKGQVNRWRWAEIKQGEIKAALKHQRQINTQRPELEAQIAQLNHSIEQLEQTSPLQRQIESLEQDLESLGYNLDEHNSLRTALRQAQPAQLRYQQLLQAEAQYPQLVQATRELTERSEARTKELMEINSQIEELAQQLAQNPDATTQIKALEAQLSQGRAKLNEQHARLGRLQQQQQHLITLETQYQAQQQQLQSTQRQYRVAQELAHAFGKKGIPALMIENLLPQLEAETNFILGRLCGDNQLHVQFVTQKAGRSPKNKLIDTLDILIADTRGTRPYETYSGGEAFRVNFAIRLALARLLAQRSGTSLQMLIVDEGFGTQDLEGCDRLVAAINAIAPDMSCILTITHMPYLKSAFGTCIEVTKTPNGSQLSLSI